MSRDLPAEFADDIRAYAARTGLALWAWNSLHASLFLMFWFIIAKGNDFYQETARRIWNTLQSDSTQREMLLSVAIANLHHRRDVLKNIKWIIDTTNTLRTYRNIAAHAPIVFSPYLEYRPDIDVASTHDKARMRFREIKHDEFWDLLIGDLNALARYAGAIAFEIYRPGFGGPLPDRPDMLCVEQIRHIDAQINRLAQIEERSHQRFASQRKRALADRERKRP